MDQDDIVMTADDWDRYKRIGVGAVEALLPLAKHRGSWVRIERSYEVCEFDGMPVLPVGHNCPHAAKADARHAGLEVEQNDWWEE